MMLESMPPDRKAPNGTSAIRRRGPPPHPPPDRPWPLCGARLPESSRLRTRRSTLAPEHPCSRRQFRHAANDRTRRGHELVGQKVVDRLEVPARWDRGVRDDRLELRSEDDALGTVVHVQGLDPQPVASETELARSTIPSGEGPHAVEPLDARWPPLRERRHTRPGS